MEGGEEAGQQREIGGLAQKKLVCGCERSERDELEHTLHSKKGLAENRRFVVRVGRICAAPFRSARSAFPREQHPVLQCNSQIRLEPVARNTQLF